MNRKKTSTAVNPLIRLAGVMIIAVLLLAAAAPVGRADVSSRQLFIDAEACYKQLRNHPSWQKYRDKWLNCITAFQAVTKNDPDGPWAAAGLYKSGRLYVELYKRSYLKTDLQEGIDLFQRIIKRFPDSRYTPKSKAALKSVGIQSEPAMRASKTYKKKISRKAVTYHQDAIQNLISSTAAPAPVETSAGGNQMGADAATLLPDDEVRRIIGLRYWSNPNYTRVVIDADGDTPFNEHLLKKDPAKNKPQRLYVDVLNSRLSEGLSKLIPINDNLLINARAGQYTPDSVRVVIDIKSFKTYKIFSLKNPFRIVIDVWGATPSTTTAQKPLITPAPEGKNMTTNDLARQLALGVRRIVIDPGHGGKDFGAPGYLKGVHEKNVALKIALRLAEKVKKEIPSCEEVILTRKDDTFLTLEERTALANTHNADLFISIHTNANRDHRAYGIETYFLNLAMDKDAILVAARENATSTKNISDLQTILSDLMKNTKINESSRLAMHVQNNICTQLKQHYKLINDKGVKAAPFYVLLGADMPAILVETAFISNPRECKRLIDAHYQEQVCDAIIEGIRKYIRETNPTR